MIREAGTNELADVLLIAGPRGIAMRLRDSESAVPSANDVRADLFGPYQYNDELAANLAAEFTKSPWRRIFVGSPSTGDHGTFPSTTRRACTSTGDWNAAPLRTGRGRSSPTATNVASRAAMYYASHFTTWVRRRQTSLCYTSMRRGRFKASSHSLRRQRHRPVRTIRCRPGQRTHSRSRSTTAPLERKHSYRFRSPYAAAFRELRLFATAGPDAGRPSASTRRKHFPLRRLTGSLVVRHAWNSADERCSPVYAATSTTRSISLTLARQVACSTIGTFSSDQMFAACLFTATMRGKIGATRQGRHSPRPQLEPQHEYRTS